MSYSYTSTETFTITHARRLGSKVAADMLVCQQYYGKPTEQQARDYAEELAQLLNGGYVSRYEFGYKQDGKRVVCWRYEVSDDGSITTNDRPGKLVSHAEIREATFYNYLWYSDKWANLDAEERKSIKEALPIKRTSGDAPLDGNGYWTDDKVYSGSGVALQRQTFQPSR